MDLLIRPAEPEDLPAIAAMEKEVEPDSPADVSVLQLRLAMFREGFLTAWHDGKLIGYAEACLWNEEKPAFSPEPDFFCQRHTLQGRILYIIFIGVGPQYQRHGVGSKLINALQQIGRVGGQQRIHAVTWDYLENLYVKQGFVAVAKLPGFLHEGDFTLLEYSL